MHVRALIIVFIGTLAAISCKRDIADGVIAHRATGGDTLVAVTLQSPQFMKRIGANNGDDMHGTLVKAFAADRGIPIKILYTASTESIYYYINNGVCSLAAFDIVPEDEYHPCGDTLMSSINLICLRDKAKYKNTTDLDSAEIYYLDRHQRARLEALRDETGQMFVCKPFAGSLDEAIGEVIDGSIECITSYDFIAYQYLYQYPELDVSVCISLPSYMSWCTSDDSLATEINEWFKHQRWRATRTEDFYRWYAYSSKHDFRYVSRQYGIISPYDNLFKKYARQINWDWRLLAALSYCESNFDPEQVSPAGAAGLMQLMPVTAKAHGYKPEDLRMTEYNLKIATSYIKTLQRYFSAIRDSGERNKFIIAAYNSGIGHIGDAMALAKKYGANAASWDDVCRYLMLKNDAKYYDDPVCKHGRFNGNETSSLIKKVFETYYFYCNSYISKN